MLVKTADVMKRRSSYLTSSIDGSLAPSSSKAFKVDHQKSQTGETIAYSDILHVECDLFSSLYKFPVDPSEPAPLSETEDAFLFLRTLYPVGAFDTSPHHRLPPIVLKHQLYALLPDRTMVDRQLVCF